MDDSQRLKIRIRVTIISSYTRNVKSIDYFRYVFKKTRDRNVRRLNLDIARDTPTTLLVDRFFLFDEMLEIFEDFS